MRLAPLLAAGLAACAACATASQQNPAEHAPFGKPSRYGIRTQGWLGVNHVELRDVDLESGSGEVTDVDAATTPVIGGVFQRPVAGERVEFGFEGGLSLAWQGNVDAVAVGGGGAVVVADADVFVTDLFGGPYLMFRLGEQARAYASAGINLEWGWFDFEWQDPLAGHVSVDGDGFGDGFYARTGLEFEIAPEMWLGLGVRVVDTNIDPTSDIDSVDMRQVQYLLTVSRWM